jgi:hypothetical protein
VNDPFPAGELEERRQRIALEADQPVRIVLEDQELVLTG